MLISQINSINNFFKNNQAVFNGGVFITGTSAILFGLLDRVPGHTAFITLAFVIRIIEAMGNAAFLTGKIYLKYEIFAIINFYLP